MKPILDVCCGSKMFYFDRLNKSVEFCDIREGDFSCHGRRILVSPDTIADFRDLPFSDESFHLVIFDPPHLTQAGDSSWLKAKYGRLDKANWRDDLKRGFSECWRVLRPFGTLVFKWSEVQIPIVEVTKLFDIEPLLGHRTGKSGKTHWMVFFKDEEDKANE